MQEIEMMRALFEGRARQGNKEVPDGAGLAAKGQLISKANFLVLI